MVKETSYGIKILWCVIEKIVSIERFRQVLKRMYKDCMGGFMNMKHGIWEEDFYFNFDAIKSELLNNER